jgi:hypothetical protein
MNEYSLHVHNRHECVITIANCVFHLSLEQWLVNAIKIASINKNLKKKHMEQQQQYVGEDELNESFCGDHTVSKESIFDKISDFFSIDAPLFFEENEAWITSAIVVLLNAITIAPIFYSIYWVCAHMLHPCLFYMPYSCSYHAQGRVISVALTIYSFNVASSFFKSSKTSQLLHATTDVKFKEYLSKHWGKKRMYVLTSKSNNLEQKDIHFPKEVVAEDESLMHSSSILSFIAKLLLSLVKLLFHFFTFSLFAEGKYNRNPLLQQREKKRHVWELSIWNYTLYQKMMICFYSPIHTLFMTLVTFGYLRKTEGFFILVTSYVFGLIIYVILGRFERRELDKNLVYREAMFEQHLASSNVPVPSHYTYILQEEKKKKDLIAGTEYVEEQEDQTGQNDHISFEGMEPVKHEKENAITFTQYRSELEPSFQNIESKEKTVYHRPSRITEEDISQRPQVRDVSPERENPFQQTPRKKKKKKTPNPFQSI